jgi:hypothetical protein
MSGLSRSPLLSGGQRAMNKGDAPMGEAKQRRERIERLLKEFIEQGEEREICSICRAPFGHNVRTYSGAAAGGALALASSCGKSSQAGWGSACLHAPPVSRRAFFEAPHDIAVER